MRLKDKVKCCHCGNTSIVDREEDICPMCNTFGTLMDIKQDIETADGPLHRPNRYQVIMIKSFNL